MTTILVTGGAGYIGSHVARQLGERGERLVTLDNLSTGRRAAVLHGDFIAGDTGDAKLVAELLAEHRIETVMHFAAHIQVPESIANPLKYYRNNTANTRTLLECCVAAGVRYFIFSSTAAVYGIPEGGIADETTATVPINPYGWSKLMSEYMLRDVAAVTPLRYVALRYFNVAGADPGGRIGQSTPEATHLIKVACEHAVGRRESISLFGTDYDTPDGTCIRDYIHVDDLGSAHIAALEQLKPGMGLKLNLGTGVGASVMDVVNACRKATGHEIPTRTVERRAGDPPALVADPSLARQTLGWNPKHVGIDSIVSSAWAWHKAHPTGYAD
jgi:UDP-glucose 4-epimerase